MIREIAVIGSGTMGNGIAHVFAQHNFKVTLIDINVAQLEKAIATIAKNLERQIAKGTSTEEQKAITLNNIITSTDINRGVKNALLVIEAATENADIKLNIFKQLDETAPADCILATNTSSISITKIAAVTKRADKVIGMHFMNPVPVMKLVEIINGRETKKEVTNAIVELSKQLEKIPCVVNDAPGFIANRILMPMINEAIYSLHEGVAGVASIDTIMKLGMAHPMGPLQLADYIGLDVCLNIINVLYDGFKSEKYAPCPLLINMVNNGKLGVKSGEGFYIYQPGNKDLTVSPQFK
ncbi:3-hydroxyacyl-CoA dehydrogenase family protein [Ferruginibacter albus]|nr:3-hydroxyacyl-CoA dehydrogenase NAD-binding domain-containing protein [Ferruginibacter albus]UAY52454.1 3-hydroxybutyryl-CoA dehydrogenase [Ferruginibacter albus]